MYVSVTAAPLAGEPNNRGLATKMADHLSGAVSPTAFASGVCGVDSSPTVLYHHGVLQIRLLDNWAPLPPEKKKKSSASFPFLHFITTSLIQLVPSTMADTNTESSPHENEVTWQTALFALMPLALGAMTQPVGAVLDEPDDDRFWIRSSSILCIADIVYFFFRYIGRCVKDRRFLHNFKVESARRFRLGDYRSHPVYRYRDSSADPTQHTELERAVIVRWILMIIGGIPCQTIKLITMRGIPVTKAVAVMFVISLVFGEAVHISALAMFSDPNASLRTTQWIPMQQPRNRRTGLSMKALYYLAGTVDSSAVSYLTMAVASRILGGPSFGVLVPMGIGLAPFVTFVVCLRVKGDIRRRVLSFLADFLPGAMIHAAFVSGAPVVSSEESDFNRRGMREWGMFILAVGFTSCFGFLMTGLVVGIEMLRGSRAERILGIPTEVHGIRRLVLFLWHVVISVLSYAYLFDGKGTVNPSWTGVFG